MISGIIQRKQVQSNTLRVEIISEPMDENYHTGSYEIHTYRKKQQYKFYYNKDTSEICVYQEHMRKNASKSILLQNTRPIVKDDESFSIVAAHFLVSNMVWK